MKFRFIVGFVAIAVAGAGASAGATVLPQVQSVAARFATTCPAYSGGSGLLADGDFSQAPYPGSMWVTYYRGATFAPDWEVTRKSIDFAGGYFDTPEGLCSVDLDGDLSLGGIVHAPFATVSGTKYEVTFLFSGNGFSVPTVKTMLAKAAGQSAQFTWDVSGGNDAKNGDFLTESFTFTADRPETRLTFRSQDPKGSCCGPVVAAISVTPAGSRVERRPLAPDRHIR
jgi:choice-of-anchor C domain-containing protein